MIMLNGGLPLKICCQIAYALEILVAFCYALVFLILDSFVWMPYMLFFVAEILFSILALGDVFANTTRWLVFVRFCFGVGALTLILGFTLLQPWLISSRVRGQGLSWHYFLFRLLYDIVSFFVCWSLYKQKIKLQRRLKQTDPGRQLEIANEAGVHPDDLN
jgi:hypothetical protein